MLLKKTDLSLKIFILLITMVLGTNLYDYYSIKSMMTENLKLHRLNSIITYMQTTRVLTFEHFSSTDPEKMSELEKNIINQEKLIDIAFTSLQDSEDKQLIEQFEHEWHLYLSELFIALRSSSKFLKEEAYKHDAEKSIEYFKAPLNIVNKLIRIYTISDEEQLQERNQKVFFISIFIGLFFAIFILLLFRRTMVKPLQEIELASKKIAAGEFGFQIKINSQDEIGRLGNHFNAMSNSLDESYNSIQIAHKKISQQHDELTKYSENLETMVNDRTAELENTLLELKASQAQLTQSEKMASLGQLIAGIAHEINTPAGAIFSTIKEIQADYIVLLEKLTEWLEELPSELHPLYLDACRLVMSASKEMSTQTRRKNARAMSPKLEGIGVEDVSNLSQNLARIGFNSENLDKYLPLFSSEWVEYSQSALRQLGMSQINVHNISIAIMRITQLVKALKSYARVDSQELVETNIKEDLNNTLIILHNQIKRGIKIHKEFDDVSNWTCFAEQLNQVWTNIIHNSIQAMRGAGDIYIRLKQPSQSEIIVELEDNGPGIPDEILPHIFDPYFTTKKKGEGSGIGLHICKEIVERHHGTINVISKPGMTKITITLPIYDEKRPIISQQ